MKLSAHYYYNNIEYDLVKETDTTKCFINQTLGLAIITNKDFDILYELEVIKNEYGTFIDLV